jgi:hypothetical protein
MQQPDLDPAEVERTRELFEEFRQHPWRDDVPALRMAHVIAHAEAECERCEALLAQVD